jgi:hypothetical protein
MVSAAIGIVVGNYISGINDEQKPGDSPVTFAPAVSGNYFGLNFNYSF